MVVIDDLKNKVVESESLVKDTRNLYLICKQDVKDAEIELKKAKKYLYRSHKNWVRAKNILEKSKSKLSRYPRESRTWAKNNFGKVMETIEK